MARTWSLLGRFLAVLLMLTFAFVEALRGDTWSAVLSAGFASVLLLLNVVNSLSSPNQALYRAASYVYIGALVMAPSIVDHDVLSWVVFAIGLGIFGVGVVRVRTVLQARNASA